MRPVKLYFAGAWAGKCSSHEVDLGIRNKLVSYVYPDQLRSWLQVAKGQEGNIIVDSGAFSVWNKGKTIDLDAYIKYAHQAISDGESDGKVVRIVNLDVIPGTPGETKNLNAVIVNETTRQKNKDLIEKAAMDGYDNLKIMISNGITPIHVYHQGESWKWLDRMLKYTKYIGVSPANDMSTASKREWINSVFEYLYKHDMIDEVDTHGFAVWIPSLLKDLPWTSCDAATWRLLAAWGGVYYPTKGGFKNPNFASDKTSDGYKTIGVSTQRNAKGMGAMTPMVIKQFEEDGYTHDQLQEWATRATINVRFFLALEKWLNEYKSQTDYIPQNEKSNRFNI